MRDPLLTPHGEQQCHHLAKIFPYHSSIDLLVASPLRRTIYTALLSFPEEVKSGKRIIALPEAQETAAVPCDTGSDPDDLKKEFQDKAVDLELVTSGWNTKRGKWAPTPKALKARAKEVRQWLKARPEKEIVLVTHGGLLHYLTQDWDDFNKVMGTGWTNTEYRSYTFVDEDGDDASIKETAESRQNRAGTEKPLTETERLALERTNSIEKRTKDIQSKV